jgi:hypothetical protein
MIGFILGGGLCAEEETRGALFGLRDICYSWEPGKDMPPELYTLRNYAILFLRRDLDLQGLESYDFHNKQTLLEKLEVAARPARKASTRTS